MVELIQRKRGKKRCMLFRSPEKTQRIGVKLFVPTVQVPSLLGMATLGLLWSKGMLWKPRLTAGPDCCCSSSHHSGHFSQPVCAFLHLFSVCRVLSQALDTQGQTRQNRFLLNFLANFSMMTSPWSSARICGWADRTLVVLTLTKPNCCCFLWGADLWDCGFLQSSC